MKDEEVKEEKEEKVEVVEEEPATQSSLWEEMREDALLGHTKPDPEEDEGEAP